MLHKRQTMRSLLTRIALVLVALVVAFVAASAVWFMAIRMLGIEPGTWPFLLLIAFSMLIVNEIVKRVWILTAPKNQPPPMRLSPLARIALASALFVVAFTVANAVMFFIFHMLGFEYGTWPYFLLIGFSVVIVNEIVRRVWTATATKDQPLP